MIFTLSERGLKASDQALGGLRRYTGVRALSLGLSWALVASRNSHLGAQRSPDPTSTIRAGTRPRLPRPRLSPRPEPRAPTDRPRQPLPPGERAHSENRAGRRRFFHPISRPAVKTNGERESGQRKPPFLVLSANSRTGRGKTAICGFSPRFHPQAWPDRRCPSVLTHDR